MNRKRLSDRELDVMQILWASEKPMIASDILKQNPSLNINTVQASIRKLLSREMIRIADIVYSGTVLCRSYEPVISCEQYMLIELNSVLPCSSKGRSAFLCSLVEEGVSEEELDELMQMIKEHKDRSKT